MTFFTSYSTFSIGVRFSGFIFWTIRYLLFSLADLLFLPIALSLIWRRACRTSGNIDRHGKTDPNKKTVLGWVDDACDDPNHITISIEQRAARISRVDRRVHLNQSF